MTNRLSAAFQELSAHLLIGAAIIHQNSHHLSADEEAPTLAGRSVARKIERLNRDGKDSITYTELNDPENATGLDED